MSSLSGSGSAADAADPLAVPLIGLAVAVLAFGTFATPMKLPSSAPHPPYPQP